MDEEDGNLKRHSRESLVYLTKCMIGHPVEAHIKNGSVYSGVFHAADLEKDCGIVLKMASLIKDGGTLGGWCKSGSEVVRKPPMETFYIPADELVQVVAKDLSVPSDGKLNAVQSEKSVEPLTDSSISKSCHVGQGRELNPWVPDGEAPEGLDNVFDKSWKSGGWNQFKANEELSGVKSTFKEDMYTTTLDKGSRATELEEKALRIAGEIEDENTGDTHVAEERGFQINEKCDTDEEAKYSAVGPVDEEDNRLTFGMKKMAFSGSSTSNVQKPTSSSGQGKGYGGESQPFQNETKVDQSFSTSDDHAGHLPSEQRSKDFPAQGSSSRSFFCHKAMGLLIIKKTSLTVGVSIHITVRASWVNEETTMIQRLRTVTKHLRNRFLVLAMEFFSWLVVEPRLLEEVQRAAQLRLRQFVLDYHQARQVVRCPHQESSSLTRMQRNSNHRNHQLLYGLNLLLQVAHSTTLLDLHRFSRCL